MFRSYRTALVLTFMVIFAQAIYYIFVLQIEKQGRYIPTGRNNKIYSPQQLTSSNRKSAGITPIVKIDNFIHVERTASNATTRNSSVASKPVASVSFLASFIFSVPDPNTYSSLPPCEISTVDQNTNESLNYRVNVSKTLYSYAEMEKKHGFDIRLGGHWYPSNCQANQRLAVVICYRQREQQLQIFLDNLHPFLKRQQLDYTIIVVNQHGIEKFNRGALFNVGYVEAMKLYPFTCFIFHDVDLLPEDSRNVYKCDSRPRHMSVAVDKFNYKLLYSTLFGGVTAFHVDDFVRSNGFPNVYWGWGNEDDDMYLRVTKKLKKNITRYPTEIARYKMIRSHGHKSGPLNPHRDTILYSKYDYDLDGINTIRYNIHQLTFYRLFTLVNVTLIEESYEQICTRLNIKKEGNKTRRR